MSLFGKLIGNAPGGGSSIGGVIGSGTEGSVLFLGAGGILAQDNAGFNWDDTNHILELTGPPGSYYPTLIKFTSPGYAATAYFAMGPGRMQLRSGTADGQGFAFGHAQGAFDVVYINGGYTDPYRLVAMAQAAVSCPITSRLAASQTANAFAIEDSTSTFISGFDKNGAWVPPSLADSSAANNSMYYSTTGSKLSYKDSGGSVHPLY
jgi:hypothetical protein